MIRATIMTPDAARIFISYSHRDEEWKDLLVEHLGVLGDQVRAWNDRDIQPGDDWKAEIERELNAARVAVLLVSVDFLRSRFVRRDEIPVLLRRREQEGLRIVPVILRPCAWRNVDWLSRLQVRPRGGQALLMHDKGRVAIEAEFASLAEDVSNWLQRAPEVRAKPPVTAPTVPASAPAARAEPPTPLPPPQAPASLAQRRQFEFETVTLDLHGRELVARRGEAVGWAEPLAEGVALEMIELPGGRYERGAADDEVGAYDDERPQHAVRVAGFAIGRFAITQAQWRVVAGWRKIKLALDADPADFKGDERPVEQVSWHDAVEFCARLSARTGRLYRLPSEAEWEYAARAGTTSPFAFGETITPAIVNYDGNHPYAGAEKGRYREGTTPVGHLGVANAFGLFDMHGNVWEWCQDLWHESYRGAPSDGRVWEQGGDTAYRVLRGGSWINYARLCRSADRVRLAPDDRIRNVGVRVVREVART
jgi:formylglycine-generating enzyme required for sulfatase activity